MSVPLAPSQHRGRRAARWAIQVLLIAGALLGIGTPALAAAHPGAPGPHQVTLTAQLTPAAPGAPGGVCQVPGIGDIGGLVGLCAQGSAGIIGDLNNRRGHIAGMDSQGRNQVIRATVPMRPARETHRRHR